MFSRNKVTVWLSVCSLFLLSSSAFACACCVERGYYSLTTSRPDTQYLSILEDMKFAGPAEFYMTVAGFDGTKGLGVLEKDEAAGKSIALDVVESFAGKVWTFNVKTESGRSGSLTLPMPATMRQLKVDIDRVDTGLGASLYKELSVNGRVRRATGIFATGNRNTRYMLLLQGRGNGCDSSSDYTDWRLELEGPRAQYAFFGKLSQ